MSIGKKNQTLQWVPKFRVHSRSHVLLPRQSEIRSPVTAAKRKSGSILAHRHPFDSNSRQATLAPMKTPCWKTLLALFCWIRVNRTWKMQLCHVPREVTGKCMVNESDSLFLLAIFHYLPEVKFTSTISSPQLPWTHFRPQHNSWEFWRRYM